MLETPVKALLAACRPARGMRKQLHSVFEQQTKQAVVSKQSCLIPVRMYRKAVIPRTGSKV